MLVEQFLSITISIVLVLLIISAIIFLFRLTRMIGAMQKQLEGLGDKPKKIIKNLTQTTTEINETVHGFCLLFRSIVYDDLEKKSLLTKEERILNALKEKIESKEILQKESITDFVNLVASAILLWKKLKK